MADRPTDAICEVDMAEGLALYHPDNRPRHLEWNADPEGRFFLAVSAIVKQTAAEYRAYIDAKTVPVDDSNGFWGCQGNAMAEAHISKATPFREIQVRRRLSETHDKVGHIDGVIVRDAKGRNISFDAPATWPSNIFLIIGEHKMQDVGDQEEAGSNVDLARRQAMNYAEMMTAQLAAGTRIFPVMEGEDASGAKRLIIPGHCTATVHAVSLRFWPRNDPKAVVLTERVEPNQLADIRDRYDSKAMAILKSPEAAAEWDLSIWGLQEFRRTLSAQAAGIDNENLLQVALECELAKRYAEQWDARKKDRSAVGCALLKRAEQKRVEVKDPADADKTVCIPTATNTASGSRWLNPRLRGDWPTERIVETLSSLKPKQVEVIA